jgi:hypothetical protein
MKYQEGDIVTCKNNSDGRIVECVVKSGKEGDKHQTPCYTLVDTATLKFVIGSNNSIIIDEAEILELVSRKEDEEIQDKNHFIKEILNQLKAIRIQLEIMNRH